MKISALTLKAAAQFKATKNTLRKAIQIAIAGSALASGLSFAQLEDFGPSDPTIVFPEWYRDTSGQALGLCRSTSAYCFPLEPNPEGFAGNIGDEAFYSLVEFVGTETGSDFQYRYLGALEASYLPGPTPKHGDDTVFARIRITFNFNDPAKNGTYTITHPYGVHVFENVQATQKTNLIGGQAANFFTVDIGAGAGFDAPLEGPVGPFVHWDSDLPLSIGTPGTPGYEEFFGDPTVPHTFTGSPFNTNFLKIEGPAGSNLDGLNPEPIPGFRTAHDTIFVTEGSVLGQKWTKPISVPLTIDSAVKTRAFDNTGKNGIDVWATTTAQQDVIVTGPGMPSLQLIESSMIPGKYHGHIEYPVAEAVPAEVRVTNLTDVNAISKTIALVDIVEIGQATFDTTAAARKLTVVAHSSDARIQPALVVQGVTGVAAGAMTVAQCAGLSVGPTDVCYSTTLASNIEPPAKLSVFSTDSGSHADRVLQLVGKPDNLADPSVASNIECTVDLSGATELLGNNCAINIPTDAKVTEQPLNGTVALVNTKWIFTPTVKAFKASDYFPEVFKYVRQVANNAAVSNEATGTLYPVPNVPLISTTTSISTTGFTINWLNSAIAKSYVVTVGGVAKPVVSAATKSFVVTGLAEGVNTTVTIAGCNLINGTRCGTAASVNQFTLPAQPAITSVSGITGFSMVVNWGAVNGATAYAFEYSNNGTNWTPVAAATATKGVRLGSVITGAATSANIIGLTANTRYSFRMTVTNPAGTSVVSAASIAQSTLNSAPLAPTLTATTLVSTSGFKLNWTARPGALSYLVNVDGVDNKVTTNTYTATGLAVATSYRVTVKSCSDVGGTNCSPVASTLPFANPQWTLAEAPTLASPSVPAAGSATAAGISAVTINALTLTWSGKTAIYTIQRATNPGFTGVITTVSGVKTTSRTITGLTANTTYYFRVIAVTPGGSSAPSVVTGQLTALAASPGKVRAVNGAANGVVTAGLTWAGVAGLTYEVMYGTAAQLTANAGRTVPATSGAEITIPAAGDIFMKVRAKSATNSGLWSANTPVKAR